MSIEANASNSPLAASNKSSRRRLIAELCGGALLGFTGASLAGPNMIGWWYEPPAKDAFNCAGSVRQALTGFVELQLICAVLGCVALFVASFLIRRTLRQRALARGA